MYLNNILDLILYLLINIETQYVCTLRILLSLLNIKKEKLASYMSTRPPV